MKAFIAQASKAGNALNGAVLANADATIKASASDTKLDQLAKEFQDMKDLEDQAKARRYEIEEEIVKLVGLAEEGTTNAEGNLFKVKTVGKLTRSLDDKAIQADWDKLPSEIKQCVKFKASLDTKNLRALESMRDDLVPVMAQYMTTKPAKPSVLVEVK